MSHERQFLCEDVIWKFLSLKYGPSRLKKQAPFVAKREEEQSAIEAVTAAALEIPAMHRRYLDRSDRAGSIQDMEVS